MKNKLRKITINKATFWWRADWFYEKNDERIICMRIWGDDKNGQPLYVNLKSIQPVYSSYPTPFTVRVIILYALTESRWNPKVPGIPYWLKEDVDDLTLDAFLLTNIRRL